MQPFRSLEVSEFLRNKEGRSLEFGDNENGTWTLTQPLKALFTDGRVYMVPAGFVSDGASIPRLLWGVYPPIGTPYGPAAVLHDWLYQQGGALLPDYPNPSFMPCLTRQQCDAVLVSGMKARGVWAVRRAIFYTGVRMGGWKPWNDHKLRREAKAL